MTKNDLLKALKEQLKDGEITYLEFDVDYTNIKGDRAIERVQLEARYRDKDGWEMEDDTEMLIWKRDTVSEEADEVLTKLELKPF